MLLKRVYSSQDMVQLLAHIEGPLSVKGFLLRFKGTSAGTAVSIADIGRIFLRRRGDVRVSVDFDVLQAKNRSDFRNAEVTGSGVIGAYAFSVYIPRVLPGSKDIEYIEPDDNYQIEIAFGANVASFTTGFVAEVYADVDVGKCWYDLQILQTNKSYPAATTAAETINGENLVDSFLTARVAGVATLVGSNITELAVEWGRNHGSGFIASWQALEAMRKPLAAASAAIGLTMHTAEGEISGALEDRLGVQFTTGGASYPIILTTGMKFNREKQIITEANDATALAGKLAEKDRAGHAQSSAVVKAALGIPTRIPD